MVGALVAAGMVVAALVAVAVAVLAGMVVAGMMVFVVGAPVAVTVGRAVAVMVGVVGVLVAVGAPPGGGVAAALTGGNVTWKVTGSAYRAVKLSL